MELDNIKMWESILKELWHYPSTSWLVECIKAALKDQGLQYNSDTKKIESIEPEPFEIKKGNWYMCIKTLDGWGGPYMEGEVYQSPANGVVFHREGFDIENETELLHGRPENNKNMSLYFRPATPEEILHEDYHWNGKIGKKEVTGVLKMMVDTVDLEELQKTKAEMLKESSDCELTEFEDRLGEIMIPTWDITKECEECKNVVYDIKKFAKELIDLARKQIASEINVDEMVQKFKDGVKENPHGILACLTLHGAYKLGMNDTLKAIKRE